MRNKRQIRSTFILVCILVLLLLMGCSKAAKQGLLPETIGQFELAGSMKGEQAKQSVSALHRGIKMDVEEAEIGEYFSGNNKAKLWISRSRSEAEAKLLFGRMTAEISKGTSPFGMPQETTIKGIKLEELEGMGQKHYYYQVNDEVVWLSVDASLGKETIDDLIEKVN